MAKLSEKMNYKNPKIITVVCLLVGLISVSYSQSIKMCIGGSACSEGTATLKFAGESVEISSGGSDPFIGCCGVDIHGGAIVNLQLNKSYTISVSGSGITSSNVADCGCGSETGTSGYEFIVDGEPMRSLGLSHGEGNVSYSVKVVSAPDGGNGSSGSGGGGSPLGGNGGNSAGGGSFSAGCSSCGNSSFSSTINSSISLGTNQSSSLLGGSTHNFSGYSMGTVYGAIQLTETIIEETTGGSNEVLNEGVNLDFFSVESIFEQDSTFQVINDTEGQISQVLTPESLSIYEETSSQEVTISFYRLQDVTLQGDGTYSVDGGAEPYVQHVYRNVGGDVSRVEILRVQGGEITSQQEFFYDDTTNSIQESLTDSYTKVEESLDESTNTKTVTTTTCQIDNGTEEVIAKELEVYQIVGDDELLVQSIIDPDGVALTTNSEYYLDSPSAPHYKKLKSRIAPDGNWTKYEYDKYGRTYRTFTPWKNSPATPDLADENNCRLTETIYTQNPVGSLSHKVLSSTEKILGITVSKISNSYSTGSSNGISVDITETSRGITNPLVSTSKRYSADAPFYLSYKLESSIKPDGTMTTYSYETGTVASGVFTPDASSTLDENRGNDRREISTNGTEDSPEGITNKTTRTISLYDDTYLISEEVQVYTGSGNYETINKTDYEYDDFSNLWKIYLNGRLESEDIYNFDRLTSSFGIGGEETRYFYDNNSNEIGSSIIGVNGQADLTTLSELDGLEREISTTTTGGDLVKKTSVKYDSAGRVDYEIDEFGVKTIYSYHNPTERKITATNSSGKTEVVENYLDGQVFSISGTSVETEYFDYEVDSNGNKNFITYYGSWNSPRFQKFYKNIFGQYFKTEKPSPSSEDTGLITSLMSYSLNGQLSTESTTGLSTISYGYDEVGNRNSVSREILGTTGQGYESLIQSESFYEKVGGEWYRVTESWLNNENNVASRKVRSSEQLTGLPINIISRSQSQSLHGEITTVEISVDRSAQTLVQTTSSNAYTGVYTQTTIGGLLSSETQPGVLEATTYEYDSLRRKTSEISPATGTTITSYDGAMDRIFSITPEVGAITTYTYYPVGHPSEGRIKSMSQVSTDDGTHTTYYDYDSRGNLYRQWGNATYPLEYGYNQYNEKTTLKTFKNTGIWNSNTWPSNTGTPATTTWNYDPASGALLSKVDDAGEATTYSHYPSGLVKRRTWARGVYVDYEYSLDGLVTKKDYSDDTPDVTYRRDRLGNIISVLDAQGVTFHDYDHETGLLDNVRYTTGLLKGWNIHNGYDSFGRRNDLQVKNGNTLQHQIGYSYEPNSGRLDIVSPSADWLVDYSYKPTTGQPTGYEHKAGGTTFLKQNKDFDAVGRLSSIEHLSGSNTVLNKYAYTDIDDFGRRKGVTLHDNTTWEYGYDDRSQVTSAVKKTSAGAVVTGSQFGATYDAIGNPTLREKGGGHSNGTLRQYIPTVNSLNQITSLSVPSRLEVLGTSSASNITVNGSSTTRQGNRYGIELPVDNSTSAQRVELTVEGDIDDTVTTHKDLPAANQSYTYDADGNLLSDGIWSYTWDGENRLKSAEYLLAVNYSEKRKLNYVYDHQNRRILKRELLWDSIKSGWYAERQIKFIYDEWNVVAEILNEATLSKTYSWGTDLSGTEQGAGGVGGLLAVKDHLNSFEASYCFDGNGNVTALVEKGTSNVIAEYEYTAFGETLTSKGTHAHLNDYRFSTKPLEKNTNQYYYINRYYSAVDGRWLSRDPIEEEGGTNLYGFVNNCSTMNIDVNGLFSWPCFAACWISMPEDEFRAYRENDIRELKRPKRRAIENEFAKKFKKQMRSMTNAQKKAFKRNKLNSMAAEKGLKTLRNKAYKKFGKIAGKKVASFLGGAAAGSVVPGAGTAVGAIVGAIISAVGAIGDIAEICNCVRKCL